MCGPREAAAPRPRVLLFLTAAALIAPRADGLQCRAGWPAAAPPRARRAWTRASMCEDAARRGDARGGRRALLDGLARGAAACGCSLCVQPAPSGAAFERFAEPPAQLREQYDPPRDAASDVALAYGFASGEVAPGYEAEASGRKRRLFDGLFQSLPRGAAVLEVGPGSLPNAAFYTSLRHADMIGVDPNDQMERYARASAERAGLLTPGAGNRLRMVHGVAEALPVEDASVDAVISILTLCSVTDAERAVREIYRVLKPGGKFLFWEHVLSEDDAGIAALQMKRSRGFGCRLDRRTLQTIQTAAAFRQIDSEYFAMHTPSTLLNPTVAGIATK